MGYDVRFGVDLFVHFCLSSRPAIHPNLSFALFIELAIGSKVILKTLQVRTSICANVGRERSYCWLAFSGYMWAITNRIAGSWWLCLGRSF